MLGSGLLDLRRLRIALSVAVFAAIMSARTVGAQEAGSEAASFQRSGLRAASSTTANGARASTRIQLGGSVTLSPSSFTVIDTNGAEPTAPRPVLNFRAFTTQEILKVAPAAKVREVRLPGGGAGYLVRVARKGDPAGAWVPLGSYIAELNHVEQYLNGFGFTLRDGPLSAAQPAHGQGVHATGRAPAVARDLGLRLQLKARRGVVPQKPAVQRTPLAFALSTPSSVDEAEIANLVLPDWNHPDPVIAGGRPAGSALTHVGHEVGSPKVANVTISALPSHVRKEVIQGLSQILQSTLKSPSATPYKRYRSSCKCKLRYGVDVKLSPQGQAIVDDAILPQTQQPARKGCGTYPADFIENYNDVCKILKECDPYRCQFIGDDPPGWSEDLSQCEGINSPILYDRIGLATSTGDVEATTGTAAKSFCDGLLHLKATGNRDCLGGYSDNNWFGASLCLAYDSTNDYSPTSGYSIVDSAGITANATVFGLGFNLIDGSTTLDWKQPPQGSSSPNASVSVTDPNNASTLQPLNDTQHFDGPSAVIPIGPIPLSVTSFLEATLSVAAPSSTFVPPPLCPAQTGAGKVGVGLDASDDLSIGIDVGVDALVLQAGVEGSLSLIKAKVDGSIASIIDPPNNKVTVDKSYGFTASELSGTLSFYVEVDLLIFSKRWDVVLASFGGLTQSLPPVEDTHSAQAVLPDSATSQCN